MQKTINIKDSHVAELVNVFGVNYQATVLDVDGVTEIPNPQTKTQFANAQFDLDIKDYIKRRVMNYRERQSLAGVDTTEITE